MDVVAGLFLWDEAKEQANFYKHGVRFSLAIKVFRDARRKIFTDSKHSTDEERYFCIGKVNGRILTVRFVYRGTRIRIIGAGYWRKGRKYYEKKDD